ncbi:MAG TPA: Rieske 2Fe-2S domain-containing protein [candidate division Zixibacteria bacterium]|nr:Rieske 2Fe-2S domain-containing protein [candidate division Zixibacteria bacterium]
MAEPRLHRGLVRCFPRPWRERYGDEMLAILAQRPPRARDVLDILAAALDARFRRRRPAPAAIVQATRSLPPARSARAFGIVAGPPVGVISRRAFMRRMLGLGAGILAIEFASGTLNFLWPQIREGLGARFRLGTLPEIVAAQPSFANGWPYPFDPAHIFLVNVPAATELALGREASVPNPTAEQLLALWRKCPHLGCLVPEPCESVTRYRCRCHGSTYNILGEKLKQGPAERGMDRFPVSVEDGVVVVDTSQRISGPPNLGPERLAFRDAHPWEAACAEL